MHHRSGTGGKVGRDGPDVITITSVNFPTTEDVEHIGDRIVKGGIHQGESRGNNIDGPALQIVAGVGHCVDVGGVTLVEVVCTRGRDGGTHRGIVHSNIDKHRVGLRRCHAFGGEDNVKVERHTEIGTVNHKGFEQVTILEVGRIQDFTVSTIQRMRSVHLHLVDVVARVGLNAEDESIAVHIGVRTGSREDGTHRGVVDRGGDIHSVGNHDRFAGEVGRDIPLIPTVAMRDNPAALEQVEHVVHRDGKSGVKCHNSVVHCDVERPAKEVVAVVGHSHDTAGVEFIEVMHAGGRHGGTHSGVVDGHGDLHAVQCGHGGAVVKGEELTRNHIGARPAAYHCAIGIGYHKAGLIGIAAYDPVEADGHAAAYCDDGGVVDDGLAQVLAGHAVGGHSDAVLDDIDGVAVPTVTVAILCIDGNLTLIRGQAVVGVEGHGVGPLAGVGTAVSLHLHSVIGGKVEAGQRVGVGDIGNHRAVDIQVECVGRGVPAHSGSGAAVVGHTEARGLYATREGTLDKTNLVLSSLDGAAIGRSGHLIVGTIAVDAESLVAGAECAEGSRARIAASVVINNDGNVAQAVIDETIKGDGGPGLGSEGHATAVLQVGIGDANPVATVIEGTLRGADNIDIKRTRTLGSGVAIEVNALNQTGIAKFGGGVDLLSERIVVVAVSGQVVVGGITRTDNMFGSGLEGHRVAPGALVGGGAVGTHRGGDRRLGSETGERIGVGGDIDEVVRVAVEANLPSSLITAGCPCELGHSAVTGSEGHAQGGGSRAGDQRGGSYGHRVRTLGSRAIGNHAEGVGGLGIQAGDGVVVGGDAGGNNTGVGHVIDAIGGTAVIEVIPCEGYAEGSRCGGQAIGGQADGDLGHSEGVVLSHAPGISGAGVDGGSVAADVAVELAIGTHDTHAVATQRSVHGNVEGCSQRGGIFVGACAGIDHLVALKGHIVVPVNPDDSTVGVAGRIGNLDRGGGAGGHRSCHRGVVDISCRGASVRNGVGHAAEAHTGDAVAVNRSGIGRAVASVEGGGSHF